MPQGKIVEFTKNLTLKVFTSLFVSTLSGFCNVLYQKIWPIVCAIIHCFPSSRKSKFIEDEEKDEEKTKKGQIKAH